MARKRLPKHIRESRQRGMRGHWRGKPKQNGFWYPGRLEAETTCDLPDPHRFRVKASEIDYIIEKQYWAYIENSNRSPRWKYLAKKWAGYET